METKSSVLDNFKTDTYAKILLINLKAGSCGLNLVEANHVIMVEPYWNDSEYQQAINRVYRIGQTKEVHVHNILIKNSLELWLKNMQELKNKMSKMLIDSHEIEIDDIEIQGEYVKRLFRCIGNVNLIERDEELHELLEQES
jgi:SNF2 family DNA or RNA helicase